MLSGTPFRLAFPPLCPICLGPGNAVISMGVLIVILYHLYFSPSVVKQLYLVKRGKKSDGEKRGGALDIIRALKNEGHRVKAMAY